jgi:hypothetical protein
VVQRWILAELESRGRDPWPPYVKVSDLAALWAANRGHPQTRAVDETVRRAARTLARAEVLEQPYWRVRTEVVRLIPTRAEAALFLRWRCNYSDAMNRGRRSREPDYVRDTAAWRCWHTWMLDPDTLTEAPRPEDVAAARRQLADAGYQPEECPDLAARGAVVGALIVAMSGEAS